MREPKLSILNIPNENFGKKRKNICHFEGNYVIIGGTACDIILSDTDMRPRATDDIDMILIIEKMTPEFGKRFWEFIVSGEYKTRQRKHGDKNPKAELFRFLNPKEGFPVQSLCRTVCNERVKIFVDTWIL